MGTWGRRRQREEKTLHAMVEIYCRAHHGGEGACKDCRELLHYAHMRLERCPFGEGKPSCAQCPVHCYKPEPREQVRQVMRFAGPHMLWHHPILTFLHLWDSWLHRFAKRTSASKRGPGVPVGTAQPADSRKP